MSDNDIEKIQKAWQESKSWLFAEEGCASEVYYCEVELQNLFTTLREISSLATGFEIISYNKTFVSLEELISDIENEKISEFILDCQIPVEDMVLKIKLFGDRSVNKKFDIELLWFPDEVMNIKNMNEFHKFEIIMKYFLRLQETFKTPNLYVGPEQVQSPLDKGASWTEIK